MGHVDFDRLKCYGVGYNMLEVARFFQIPYSDPSLPYTRGIHLKKWDGIILPEHHPVAMGGRITIYRTFLAPVGQSLTTINVILATGQKAQINSKLSCRIRQKRVSSVVLRTPINHQIWKAQRIVCERVE